MSQERTIVNAANLTWGQLKELLFDRGLFVENFHATRIVSGGAGSALDFASGSAVNAHEEEHLFMVVGDKVFDETKSSDVTDQLVGEWHSLVFFLEAA